MTQRKKDTSDLCSFHEEDPNADPRYKGQPIRAKWCEICKKMGDKKEEKVMNQITIYNTV